MKYITVNNRDYQLRLTAKACIELEKQLGVNPLSIFSGVSEDNIPSMVTLLGIFAACLKPMNHGVTDDRAWEIFDDFMQEGHDIQDFITVIIDTFRDSGFLPKEDEEEEKN